MRRTRTTARARRGDKVLRAVDRLIHSDARDPSLVSDGIGSLLDALNLASWSDAAVRNLVSAIVSGCPNSDFAILDGWAEKELAFVDEFEVAFRYRRLTGSDLKADVNAVKRAIAGPIRSSEVIDDQHEAVQEVH